MSGSEKLLREGATVYQLIHDRYKKGIEQFRNKFSFRVYADKDAGIADEEVARRLVACWNALATFTTEEIEAGTAGFLHRYVTVVDERNELFELVVLMNATFEDVWIEYEQSALKKHVQSVLAKYKEAE